MDHSGPTAAVQLGSQHFYDKINNGGSSSSSSGGSISSSHN